MSRLYAWLGSDTSQKIVTKGGDKFMDIQINYGSRDNSKKAVRLLVRWERGEEKPTVHLTNFIELDKRV